MKADTIAQCRAVNQDVDSFSNVGFWRQALIVISVALVLLLVVHTATFSEVVAVWNRSNTYKFAWVVLPTLAYLFWFERKQFHFYSPDGSCLGVFTASLCAVLWLTSDLMNISVGRQLALIGGIYSIILASVGVAAFRKLLPFLYLMLFLVPLGDFLIPTLKSIALLIVAFYAKLTGLPFQKDGFAMFVNLKRYVVIDYCTGLPYVLIGMFFGMTYGLLLYKSIWKILLLSMFAGLLAVVANGLRIIGIVSYDYFNDTRLTLEQHGWFEMPALLLCFLILFWVFSRLKPEDVSLESRANLSVNKTKPIYGIVWALLAAIIFSLPPLFLSEKSGLIETKPTIPLHQEDLAGWKQLDRESEWQPRSRSESVITSTTVYENMHHNSISLFVARPATLRSKVSGGAINLNVEGWMPSENKTISTCNNQDCIDFLYNKFVLKGSQRVRHIYSFYVVDGTRETSVLKFRLGRVISALKGNPSDAQYIAVASENERGLPVDQLTAFFQVVSSRQL